MNKKAFLLIAVIAITLTFNHFTSATSEEDKATKDEAIEHAMEDIKKNMKPIKKAAKSGWATVPVKEIKAIAKIFKDMDDLPSVQKHKKDFKDYLAGIQKASQELADAASAETPDKVKLAAMIKKLDCKSCHKKYKKKK